MTKIQYINDLSVAIKSLIAYNDSLHIYVVNTDISSEFFLKFNEQLTNTNNRVFDWKIDENELKWDASFEYISKISYARLLIPDLLPHLKRVLYLDCDIVVTDNLDRLFEISLEGNPIGMAIDWFYFNTKDNRYNSGVMLIDCELWREKGYVEGIKKEVDKRLKNNLKADDQSVVNGFFNYTHIFELSTDYNAAYGSDILAFSEEIKEKFTAHNSAKIIHFTGPYKPSASKPFMRGRQKWWDFYFMSVNEALQLYVSQQIKKQVLVYTRTENMRGIVELAQAFPKINFLIVAPTKVSLKVLKLNQHPNVFVKSNVRARYYDYSNIKAILMLGEEESTYEESQYFNEIGLPILTYRDLAYKDIIYEYQADGIADLIAAIKEKYS
ncbi:glycosyltransferase family 8 protein [Ligilactobacillus equi]